MGCCFSTPTTTTTTDGKNAATSPPLPPPHHHHLSDRTPPPPLIEEETVVKEVLSETPKSNISKFQQINDPKKAMLLPLSGLQQQELKNDTVLKVPRRMVFNPDEISEDATSEICSSTLSECVSNEVNADVSKIRQRSPAKYRNRQVSGERLVGQSPARRSEHSLGRVRSGPGPGPGKGGGGSVGNGQRRGLAQSPDRRSRSPVTRVDGSGARNGLGRCPSARRTGISPGRVGSELSEKIRKVENGNGNRDSKLPPASDESLENPLVSLECFIFL